MARLSGSRRRSDQSSPQDVATELSYSEAQAALELALAELQSTDLPVEAMNALYQRARSYADRCEQVLHEVEQSIQLWDPQNPDTPPQDYEP
jgi:exodeoxyribonuclease VII small subunit